MTGNAMPDYYQLLRQALAATPDRTPQTRNAVYNRAHHVLQEKLRSVEPQLDAAGLQRESNAFRQAVARLEAEFGARAQEAAGQTQKPQLAIVGAGAQTHGEPQSPTGAATASQADTPQNDAAAAARPAPARRTIADGDHEFLPAALEILETPPSPVRMRMLLAICAFVVCGLLWSWFGKLDIVAVAQGKFQPTGRVNVVQPVETGKVKAIRVANNSRVKEGDVLVEMEASDAQAEVSAQSAAASSLRGEIVRRRAAAGIIASRKIERLQKLSWPEDVSEEARLREQRVFESDLAQVASTIASLQAQLLQKEAEIARVNGTIKAQEQFVKTLQERVSMREQLVARAAGARANVIDALERLNEQQTQLAIQRGQLKEAQASAVVLTREIEKTFQNAEADNSQKLLQAQRQFDDVEQRLAKAKVRFGNTVLRAPNAGTVQALSIINPGQVVSAGEHIMRVVPDGLGMEIEGYVQNKDIGFIKEGQEAIVKVDSFPFTRYGYIEAKVTKIARDAVPLPEATQAEANPGQSQRATGAGGAQRTQNLVYQVTLQPLQDKIGPEGDKIQLMPGMTVTFEVKTGQRRIISYLFTPLVEVGSAAMRER
jgi:hemolysin D